MRFTLSTTITLSACLLFASCSSGPSRDPSWPDTVPVKGTLTKGGEPIANSLVTFSPVDSGSGFMARGMTNDAGEFTLGTSFSPSFDDEGAAAGKYNVLVAEPIKREVGGIENETSQADFEIQYNSERGKPGEKVVRVVDISYSNPATTPLTATVKGDGSEETFSFEVK